jgi:predicted RNA-binding protein associated with RNAse of E/G family
MPSRPRQRKLLPEARENASYKQDVDDLKTALAAKKISQEQYDKTAERLEANHQANLAKIRAQQVVTRSSRLKVR